MNKNITQNQNYDLTVIGGGPAGMMTAISAASKGKDVALIEKNRRLGQKLLLTGKGRCNITNAENDIKKFAKEYGKNAHFLLPALYNFTPQDTLHFFMQCGINTKIERGNRVFPQSDKASDVLRGLVKMLNKQNVEILLNTKVVSIISKNNTIKKINTDKGDIISKNYVVATGGLSYPETGSTGDGYKWAEKLGHKLILPRPALVGVIVKEKWIKQLQGLSLKNVKITLHQPSDPDHLHPSSYKKLDEKFGEALFTNVGMSGPIILDMSKKIGGLLQYGPCKLVIDFKPALDFTQLDKRLLNDFQEFDKKMFKNSLNQLLPSKIIPLIIELSKINPEKRVNQITRNERSRLLHLLKEFELTVTKTEGFEKAIVTAGGIELTEIDSKTMKSKIIDNLYLAGEILDIDGPTGGYNLQMCWSTGSLAGKFRS
ncbi:aminoacetone oxidase family FAD-binding enzyme [Candidatus Dojkabacteria bacterium]|nr:aminoacetone oxidase family FAD-binding enzyme [Candidatus Dojkabacteria bacterium]